MTAVVRELGTQVELVREGDLRNYCFVLVNGWAASFKTVDSGSRQIIDFAVPGDFLAARSLALPLYDQTIETLTPCVVASVPIDRYVNILTADDGLGRAMRVSASRDEAILTERIVNLGRRSGIQRLAHLLMEIRERLGLVGLCDEDGCDFPITQYHLADALGLSAIHVNRIVRQLREAKLITLHHKRLEVRDEAALARLSKFDDSYLGVA